MGELSITLTNRGLMTAQPHDVIPDGFFPNFLNMTAQKGGYIENRQGTERVSSINLGGPIHSQGRMLREYLSLNSCPTEQPVLGVYYSYLFVATGGVLPLTWSISAGTLPTGLTLAGGSISGTPSVGGQFPYTLKVQDSNTPPHVLQINCLFDVDHVVITSTCPTDEAVVDTPYEFQCTATGGVLPYAWTIDSGALPTGLTLDGSTGLISGTPSMAGAFSFVIKVTDSSVITSSDTDPCSMTVGA